MTNVKTLVQRAVVVVTENKDVIKRKLIVTIGTGVGMLIASALVDHLTKQSPDIIILENHYGNDSFDYEPVPDVIDTPTTES